MERGTSAATVMFRPVGKPPVPDGTPEEIRDRIGWEPREPVPLERRLPPEPDREGPTPRHRLVVLGDSLSQGFKSFAISETALSWPAMVARYGGIGDFRYPRFPGPEGCAGLPLNLEKVIELVDVPPTLLNTADNLVLLRQLRQVADVVEDYWERGDGADLIPAPRLEQQPDQISHNLAIWGQDIRDALSLDVETLHRRVRTTGRRGDNFVWEVPSCPMERAGLLTLTGARERDTPVSLAKALGRDGGIETLIVALGANNILGTVLSFSVHWSEDEDFDDVDAKKKYNAWTPEHFRAEFDALLQEVRQIDAKNVIVFTVPHVTIAPMVRGVGTKMPGDRYFARYTRPWISDHFFNPNRHDTLTGEQLRVLDFAIDLYNDHIVKRVEELDAGTDAQWRVLDVAGMLDRLAYRRFLIDDEAAPSWWEPYDLPDEYRTLSPRPDTRFFRSDRFGRIEGGLFSLDGIHPTTAGYALVAREVMNLMAHLRIPLAHREPDYADVLIRDSLLQNPPEKLATLLTVVAFGDRLADLLRSVQQAPPRWGSS